MKTYNDLPITLIAHRGASGIAPENTLASLQHAIAWKSDYSEIDVRLTKDNQIILMHDATLNRTTNGRGFVWNHSWESIKTLEAGSWFSKSFEGEKIPLLQEAIQAVKGKQKLNIEMKTVTNYPKLVDRLLQLLKEEEFEDQCMITSFNARALYYLIEKAPHLQTGIIRRIVHSKIWKGPWQIISFDYQFINKRNLLKANNSGKTLMAWTVNKTPAIRKLIRMGVTHIITNYPDRFYRALSHGDSSPNSSGDIVSLIPCDV